MKRTTVYCSLVVALLVVPVLVGMLGTQGPAYNALATRSEVSHRVTSSHGHPDLFSKIHDEMRGLTQDDMYPMNYQVAEYQKARAALNGPGSAIAWQSRGPANVGGRTRAIVVDPDDPDLKTWYAGAVGGGVWKTEDGGMRWTSLTDHLPNLGVSCLAMAESDHDVMYMGTGEGFGNFDAVSGSGIFKSTNRGDSWEQLMATATDRSFRYVNRLAIDPTDHGVVIAATNKGIYRTTDGGMTWTEVYSADANVQDLKPQPGNFDVQVATLKGKAILRSTDGGQSWEQAFNGFLDVRGGLESGRMEIAWSPSEPETVHVLADKSAVRMGLIRSDDAGLTWTPTFDHDEDQYAPTNPLGPQGWHNQAIAVHPYSPDTVFIGGDRLLRIVYGSGERDESGPRGIFLGESDDFMSFLRVRGAVLHSGIVVLGINQSDVTNVEEEDYVSIDFRFGQGTQKAHAFTVAKDGGTNGDGGAGIGYADYMYSGYVEVPFQVWDTDNDRQLMVSFRDQAADSVWNLIPRQTQGPRDGQSREYLFVHKYDYDDSAPHAAISQDGGVADGMLYYMWPHLTAGATWDPGNLPVTDLTIAYARGKARERIVTNSFDPNEDTHSGHHNITILPIDRSTNEFYVINANDGGVAYSKDGGDSFVELDADDSGYNTSQFFSVAKRPGVNMYLGGAQDNGTWRSEVDPDAEEGWKAQIGGYGFDAVWHATDENKLLGTGQHTFILRSTDGGDTWRSAMRGLPESNPFFPTPFATSLGYSDRAPDRVFTLERSGVWRSDNFGQNWAVTAITEKWGFSHAGRVRVSKSNPDVVWAGYYMDAQHTLHVSTDAGQSFAPVVTPSFHPDALLSGLNTHPSEDSTGYALFSRYSRPKILETRDFGSTWEDLSGFAGSTGGQSTNGFPNVGVYDLLVMPGNPHVLWAATDIGIFKSTSRGNSWVYADNGLPSVSVWQLDVRDDQILAATHGRGVWTAPLSEVDVATEDAPTEVPASFSLEQNYPNPFNPTTTISFSVPAEAHVRISVFDVTGRKVATLAERVYSPGVHELSWEASTFASGIYFYRMKSDARLIQTRKMTLVK